MPSPITLLDVLTAMVNELDGWVNDEFDALINLLYTSTPLLANLCIAYPLGRFLHPILAPGSRFLELFAPSFERDVAVFGSTAGKCGGFGHGDV